MKWPFGWRLRHASLVSGIQRSDILIFLFRTSIWLVDLTLFQYIWLGRIHFEIDLNFLKQIEDTETCLRDLPARKEIVLALFAPDEGEDDYNDDDYYGGDYTDDDYYDDDYDHQVDHD